MNVYVNPNEYVEGSARLQNGNAILPNEIYTILTLAFNLDRKGGDDFVTVYKEGVLQNEQYSVFGPDLKSFKDGIEINKVYRMDDIVKQKNLFVL